jgi:hypothetical protein
VLADAACFFRFAKCTGASSLIVPVIPAVRHISPTAQKRVCLAINLDRMKPTLEPDVQIRVQLLFLEHFTNCQRALARPLHQLLIGERH